VQWHYNFPFCFAKPINKSVCNSSLDVEPTVLILASRLKATTSFFWPSQRVPRLSPAQRTSYLLEVKYAIKLIVWVATQTRVAISQSQKISCAETIKTLSLQFELQFFKLVLVCLQCSVGTWEKSRMLTSKMNLTTYCQKSSIQSTFLSC